jgi:hypothetical protein
MTQAVQLAQYGQNNVSLGFKNRIINGAMTFDQRNAGASVTYDGSSGYSLDRYFSAEIGNGAFTVQQVTDAPAGFTNSLKVTVTTAQTGTLNAATIQSIEGFNIADLGWGTASAKTVTLSFWIKSSVTGSLGGALRNSASNRSYPFNYSVSSANTWEYKTVTIAGDTTGTWATGNTTGIVVLFSHGTSLTGTAGAWAGSDFRAPTGSTFVIQTLGATWQITGVQLEVGTQATSFEYRQYQQELALCQRYYYKLQATTVISPFSLGFCESTTVAGGVMNFPVSLRVSPTALEQQGTAGNYTIRQGGTDIVCSSVPSFVSGTVDTSWYRFTVSSGLTTGQAVMLRASNTSPFLAWNAEL